MKEKVDVQNIVIALRKQVPDNDQVRAYIVVKIKGEQRVYYVEAYTGLSGKFTITNVDDLGPLTSGSSKPEC